MFCRFVGLFAGFCLLPAMVLGACSQSIVVPAAPAGKFLVTDEQTQAVTGVYADLLRSSGKAMGCTFTFPLVPRARFQLMLESGDGQLFRKPRRLSATSTANLSSCSIRRPSSSAAALICLSNPLPMY